MPALLNLTAVQSHYAEHDPKVLDQLLLTPRKVFSSTKVLKESKAGIYNESSLIQQERWYEGFDPKYNLPPRRDAYSVQFTSKLDDFSIVTFKTAREKEIQVGRSYNYEPMGVGQCKMVYEDDNSAASMGVKDGQIIFMRHGPFNFLQLVNDYEAKHPDGMSVMKNVGLAERELRHREKKLINSFIQMPCRVELI